MLTVAGTDEDSQDSVIWTLIFDRSGGAATMSSDDFKVSKKYSEDVAEGSVSVSGMDEAYIGLVGGDAEPLRKALAAYMAKNVPQASSASFDGEASVDFNAKTVSASFHADDPATTVLVVAYADGEAHRRARVALAERIGRATLAQRRFLLSLAGSALFCAAMLWLPQPAHADIADTVNSWLCGMLRDFCNWIFGAQVDVLRSIGAEGVLSASFETMLGGSGTVSMYDIVHGVWESAILPIGCGVLSFVFTVQLIKISQRMDGSSSMPAVKEVVFLLVFFAVFLFLVQHSFELMQALYEVTRIAIQRVTDLFGNGAELDMGKVSITTTDDDVPALLGMAVVALVSWVVVLVAYIVALVVSWARAIQLYLMAAFSPIPLSLMGLEDTRQIGIGYLRSFASVCLAGVIILVILVSFPVVLGGLDAVNAGTGTPMDSVVGGLSYALQYLAVCVLLILSLVKMKCPARRHGRIGGREATKTGPRRRAAARTPVPPFFGAPCPNRCLSGLG